MSKIAGTHCLGSENTALARLVAIDNLDPVELSPLRDYVLCDTLPDPPKSHLLVTVNAPNTAQRAKIRAVGPECKHVKPGDTVLVSRLIGQTVGEQVLIQEPYILAWL